MDYSSLFVCLMGMGTVFFGLICLIVLTTLMSAICGRGHSPAAPVPAVPAAPPAPAEDRQALAAAIAAAVAEDLGTDVTEKTVIRFWEKEFGS